MISCVLNSIISTLFIFFTISIKSTIISYIDLITNQSGMFTLILEVKNVKINNHLNIYLEIFVLYFIRQTLDF